MKKKMIFQIKINRINQVKEKTFCNKMIIKDKKTKKIKKQQTKYKLKLNNKIFKLIKKILTQIKQSWNKFQIIRFKINDFLYLNN